MIQLKPFTSTFYFNVMRIWSRGLLLNSYGITTCTWITSFFVIYAWVVLCLGTFRARAHSIHITTNNPSFNQMRTKIPTEKNARMNQRIMNIPKAIWAGIPSSRIRSFSIRSIDLYPRAYHSCLDHWSSDLPDYEQVRFQSLSTGLGLYQSFQNFQ